jgi:hypothetical protein
MLRPADELAGIADLRRGGRHRQRATSPDVEHPPPSVVGMLSQTGFVQLDMKAAAKAIIRDQLVSRG